MKKIQLHDVKQYYGYYINFYKNGIHYASVCKSISIFMVGSRNWERSEAALLKSI